MKGKISKTGYRKDSKDRHNDYNIVPSSFISMKSVPYPIFAQDNLGNQRMMYPDEEHEFEGDYVTEFPMKGFHQMPDGSMMSDDEMKRGGQHKRKTSKNIKSSINELFLRNYDVYGPRGRRIYDPNAKHEGGEHMKNKMMYPWMQFGGPVDEDVDFDVDNAYDYMKKGGIFIKPSKRGTFTAAATKHKMGVQEFASHVLANPDKFSAVMKKKANFARNASNFNHQFGGDVVEGDYENNFDNPFFGMGGPTPEQAKLINRAVPEKKLFGNAAKPSGVKFQMGGTPKFKNPQQFHDYYGKQLGYKLVPGAKTEYYDPALYSPTSTTDRLAPWTAKNNAPLSTGNYPQQTYGYDSTSAPMNFKQASPAIDTSKNPYQQVGFGQNPTFINKLTGQPVPASVVMQERQAQLNPTDNFKDGGAFLKALVKNAYKDVTRKGGESSPQGMTGDEYREGRNNMFKSYLSNNALKSIAMEEISNLQDMHNYMKAKCGGMYQEGGENDEQSDESYWDNLVGYTGAQEFGSNPNTPIPQPKFNFNTVQNDGQREITSQMSSDQLAGQQGIQPQRSMYDLMSNDIQAASFQQPQQENQGNGSNWFSRNRGDLAEGLIAGMNFGAAALNAKDTRAKENLLNQRMSADNLFMSNQFGSVNRGQYDTNSGMFRPNQYNFSQNRGNMKFGGESDEEQYLSDAEIKRLERQGYKIQYLD